MVSKIISSLLAGAVLLTPMAIQPAFAQAQAPQTAANGKVCQTFLSNGTPYGYIGVDNVDLGAVFSSIDTITGTLYGTRSSGSSTLTIAASPPSGQWRNQGYLVPAWGPTGGWSSFTTYLGGASSGPPMMQVDVVDVRFGTQDGINPGKAQVPQGSHGLYVVQRNETGHAPLRLTIQRFNLTICGAPKTGKLCKILSVSQNPAGRFSPAAMIPSNFGAPKKVVSVTGNLTIAATSGKLAETQAVKPTVGNTQPRTYKFPVAMNNRDFLFFSVASNHVTAKPIDTWRGQSGQPHYIRIGDPVTPGHFVSPVNSWVGAPGAIDTPSHGDGFGDIELCVQ